MTDDNERLKTAKRKVIDAIKDLFVAWREADRIGGPEEFFDSTLDPSINVACKEIGI